MSYMYSPTSLEVKLATMIAIARCDHKEKNGIKSNKYVKNRTEVETHVLGILGEFAVSTCLGIPVKMPITSSGDDGWDLRSTQCGRISVKTRMKSSYDFAMTKQEMAKDWDIGILVLPKGLEIQPPYEVLTLRLAGWITKGDFVSKAGVNDFGYGVRHSVSHRGMKPMVELPHKIGSYSVRAMLDLHGLIRTYESIVNDR